jgi:hypothetical protein
VNPPFTVPKVSFALSSIITETKPDVNQAVYPPPTGSTCVIPADIFRSSETGSTCVIPADIFGNSETGLTCVILAYIFRSSANAYAYWQPVAELF